MTDTLTFEHGTFSLDADARTVRGLLLPWNEPSRLSASQTEPIAFQRGSVAVPRDVSIVTANRNHDRFDPVARATSLEDTDAGIVATFAIADTDEGDALIREHGEGLFRRLSAEMTGIVRDARDRTRGIAARLTGAAFVPEGAFASAALFAIGEIAEEDSVTFTPEDGVIAIDATDFPKSVSVSAADDTRIYIHTPEPEEESEFAVSTVANTNNTPTTGDIDLAGLFALIADRQKAGFDNGALRDAESALMALADIHYDKTGTGNNSLGAPIRQPAFVGELWTGRSFARKVIPLLNKGQLKAMNNTGYKFTQKPTVALWSGNKSEIPTSTGKIEPYSYSAKRYAGGWDIAREYIDFNELDVIEAFLRQAVNSYAEVTDNQALTDLVAASTPLVAGAAPTGISEAAHKVVEGALAVIAAGGSPSAALVTPTLYKQLILQKEMDRFAFLDASIGLEEGSVAGFKIVPHSGLAAGTAVVLDKNAATAEELSETPIRVSALDLARGGFDEALHGYYATRVDHAPAIVRVTTS